MRSVGPNIFLAELSLKPSFLSKRMTANILQIAN